ncbi:His-Xaa-Ser system protein HxsD [uncultured Chitinophaga sp.]|uniref:His-Xaa-Ser system protein HxsD n=1 Tax=uncultured Chitinophaga sp. TaxID=339340 RepID=UPI0025F1F1E0|nr:His-Xaa-Ser system protein HxsD [uncultured Chitinophaga sp.]
MNYIIDNHILSFQIDAQIYNEETVLKTLYWLSGSYQIDLRKPSELCFTVQIKPTHNEITDWNNVMTKINKDLIDNQLRYIIKIETCNIRDLIVAKAFLHYDLLNEPENPVSDPVGFDPKAI